MSKKIFLVALLVLNAIVICGQIWPEYAPPFSSAINIAFLSLSFIYFAFRLIKKK